MVADGSATQRVTFTLENPKFYNALTVTSQSLSFHFLPTGVYLQSSTPLVGMRGNIPTPFDNLDRGLKAETTDGDDDDGDEGFRVTVDQKASKVLLETFAQGKEKVHVQVTATPLSFELVLKTNTSVTRAFIHTLPPPLHPITDTVFGADAQVAFVTFSSPHLRTHILPLLPASASASTFYVTIQPTSVSFATGTSKSVTAVQCDRGKGETLRNVECRGGGVRFAYKLRCLLMCGGAMECSESTVMRVNARGWLSMDFHTKDWENSDALIAPEIDAQEEE